MKRRKVNIEVEDLPVIIAPIAAIVIMLIVWLS